MRYRIDGVLYEMMPPPKHIAPAIAQPHQGHGQPRHRRAPLPQDGRIELWSTAAADRPARQRAADDVRRERRHARARPQQRQLDLDKIGCARTTSNIFRQLIHKPNGIVIVTGPTGSRQDHHALLRPRELNEIDPPRSSPPRTRSSTTSTASSSARSSRHRADLRPHPASILRQDPDIILVGEIRDLETAEIAVQASLTGHLVFSTLHTNDAPASIARLLDLGWSRSSSPPRSKASSPSAWCERSATTARPSTAHRGAAHGTRPAPRRRRGQEVLLRQGLRLLQQHRLQAAEWASSRSCSSTTTCAT
jgi:type IV pilus assembly protein PilB